MRRNCSVTPAQVGWMFVSLSSVSCLVAGFFWSMGAKLVLPFTLLELTALGAALLVYARHATDGERVSLQPGWLVVERETGGKLLRSEFAREWVRVEPGKDPQCLIEVRAGGQSVQVGRFVRSDLRPALAREIRLALRGA